MEDWSIDRDKPNKRNKARYVYMKMGKSASADAESSTTQAKKNDSKTQAKAGTSKAPAKGKDGLADKDKLKSWFGL